ncbi:hypothetical protein Q3G72_003362 [Acer saccharum]|nr:hypothetical protein Q3G72_003362 [Acer saccharum]
MKSPSEDLSCGDVTGESPSSSSDFVTKEASSASRWTNFRLGQMTPTNDSSVSGLNPTNGALGWFGFPQQLSFLFSSLTPLFTFCSSRDPRRI